ncbi:MAG: FAD binding domain-containing protein [Cyclobacteriaceae bacterium]|nr:FAD binding domain-containing protein [Cyclobacteriaceae bacterium]
MPLCNNATCASVHSSSVSTALLAFGARVVIASADGKTREVEMNTFFVHPETNSKNETILKAGELITQVILPPVKPGTKSWYIKQGARESHDWAMADVAVVAQMTGNTCSAAEIVLGAAAPIPIKSKEAAGAIIGKTISESTAKAAGNASMKGATPLSGNAYKIPVFKAIVKRAILNLV